VSAPRAGSTRTRASLINPPNLPGFGDEFPLGPELEQQLGTRVFLGNDVSVATDAEFRSAPASRTTRSSASSGARASGGGLILDGKQWVGRGSAGEIGHVVVHPGGDKCGCGRKGCMEAYAGRGRMERRRAIATRRARRRACSRSWKSAVATA
jgi:glucokinase